MLLCAVFAVVELCTSVYETSECNTRVCKGRVCKTRVCNTSVPYKSMQYKCVQAIWSLKGYIDHSRPLHLFLGTLDSQGQMSGITSHLKSGLPPSVFQYVLSVAVRNG